MVLDLLRLLCGVAPVGFEVVEYVCGFIISIVVITSILNIFKDIYKFFTD